MTHQAMAAMWAAVFPWLVLVLGLQRVVKGTALMKHGWTALLAPGVIAAGILLIPVQGATVARWVASVVASVSVPLAGLMALTVWRRAFGTQPLTRREWGTAWMFGAVAGLLLYPAALGVGRVDPYEWGWYFSPLFVASGVLTAWLIWRQNRFGLLLLLAVAAFQLHILESSNYWDYLIDPIYFGASLIGLAKWWRTRRAVP